MGIFGISTGKDMIHFGSYSDVCYLCAQELGVKERIHIVQASNKLKGSYEGKKLLKLKMSGSQIAICMDHIHKISDDNKEVEGDAE